MILDFRIIYLLNNIIKNNGFVLCCAHVFYFIFPTPLGILLHREPIFIINSDTGVYIVHELWANSYTSVYSGPPEYFHY